MFTSKTNVRVRYAETDRMGYVYYGNYAQYYEIGRVEALRELGISYKMMEDEGIMLPVTSLETQYIKPAFYDDVLTISTSITELPTVRIKFYYEVLNQKAELLNKGTTTLVFIDRITNKPTPAPDYIIQKLEKHLQGN